MKRLMRTLGLPIVMLVIGCSLLCGFAPWQQVHPADASLVHSLDRAALWTHAYDHIPGAKLDGFELAVEAVFLLAACALTALFGRNVNQGPSL